ncbi:MAG: PEGA domain-containing protein [Gammaproteobacteria bacterium]|nr:PEGA domain-containing protein [Gammaproteobacteria bacterium]
MTRPRAEDAAPRLIRPAPYAPPSPTARVAITWRRQPLLLCAALALWAWAAWFMFTARAVTLTTTPTEATLRVDHGFAPHVGRHWLLRPGPHRVEAHAPGHAPLVDTLLIGDDAQQAHALTLTRLPGHLRLRLAPDNVVGEVSIDGHAAGAAPGLRREVAAGTRTVEISVPRYRPWTATVDVEGKGIEQTLDVVLQPAWADYQLASQPEDASLSIDGIAVGHTPLRGELLEGRRVLRLEKSGYQPWQQALEVKAGVSVQLGTVVLREAEGEVALVSTPPGASVTVDDAYVGRTPLTLSLAPGKAHRLAVLAEGYVPLTRELEVASAAHESLTLTLEPELAELEFDTTPQDAELLVDGVARGVATQRLALPTHAHEITIRARGYATWQTRIVPRKDVLKRFRVQLRTIAEAGAAPQAPIAAAAPRAPTTGAAPSTAFQQVADGEALTTSLGQVLRLFTGGRARLGAPRGDARRRADEVERTADLRRPFYLAAREVSNGEFRRFLATHHVAPQGGVTLDDDAQPVANVDWAMAAQYCNWLSRRDGLPLFYQISYGTVLGVNPAATGYRLPTEAEWEWAAGSDANGARRAHPWGDAPTPPPRSGNYADGSAASLLGEVLRGYDDGFAAAAPVGSFAPDARGLYDLGGNVAEWVHDYYDAAPAGAQPDDPLGPPAGDAHVIKGASWAQGAPVALRAAFRAAGTRGRNDVGFRLARYAR